MTGAYQHLSALVGRGMPVDELYEAACKIKRELDTDADVEAVHLAADQLNEATPWPCCCPVSVTGEDVRRVRQ